MKLATGVNGEADAAKLSKIVTTSPKQKLLAEKKNVAMMSSAAMLFRSVSQIAHILGRRSV